jgi:exonuclease III
LNTIDNRINVNVINVKTLTQINRNNNEVNTNLRRNSTTNNNYHKFIQCKSPQQQEDEQKETNKRSEFPTTTISKLPSAKKLEKTKIYNVQNVSRTPEFVKLRKLTGKLKYSFIRLGNNTIHKIIRDKKWIIPSTKVANHTNSLLININVKSKKRINHRRRLVEYLISFILKNIVEPLELIRRDIINTIIYLSVRHTLKEREIASDIQRNIDTLYKKESYSSNVLLPLLFLMTPNNADKPTITRVDLGNGVIQEVINIPTTLNIYSNNNTNHNNNRVITKIDNEENIVSSNNEIKKRRRGIKRKNSEESRTTKKKIKLNHTESEPKNKSEPQRKTIISTNYNEEENESKKGTKRKNEQDTQPKKKIRIEELISPTTTRNTTDNEIINPYNTDRNINNTTNNKNNKTNSNNLEKGILACFEKRIEGFTIKIHCQNINGGWNHKIQTIAEESIRDNIDIIMLQEIKMKKEEENNFVYNPINREYLTEVNNLSLEERIKKRDANIEKRVNNQITVPQDNPGASEGLLTAVRLVGSTTKWPCKFYNPMKIIEDENFSKELKVDEIEDINEVKHKIITVALEYDNKNIYCLHNVYAPCDRIQNRKTLKVLNIIRKFLNNKEEYKNKNIHHVECGDFNGIIQENDIIHIKTPKNEQSSPSINNMNNLREHIKENNACSAICELINSTNEERFTHRQRNDKTGKGNNTVFRTKSLIDHVIIDEKLLGRVKRLAIEERDASSDHSSIILSLVPIQNKNNNKRTINKKMKPKLKTKIKPNRAKTLKATMENIIMEETYEDIKSFNNKIYEEMKNKLGTVQNKKKHMELDDKELDKIKSQNKDIRIANIRISNNEDSPELRSLITRIKQRAKANKWLDEKWGIPSSDKPVDHIQWLNHTQDITEGVKRTMAKRIKSETIHRYIQEQLMRYKDDPPEFFRRALNNTGAAKFISLRDPKIKTTTQDPDRIINILKETWQEILTTQQPVKRIPEKYRNIIKDPKNCEQLIKEITIEELNYALAHVREYTAPGMSGIPTEVWKNADNKTKELILHFFNNFFNKEEIPEEWKITAIILLEKDEKNREDPTKYRPIALLDTLYKIYTAILSIRLTKFINDNNILSPLQAGYQKGKTTHDQISILVNILEDRKLKPTDEFGMILVDLVKFFDSVEHWLIEQILKDYGIPEKFIKVIMSLYADNKAFIITPHGDSEFFPCTRGVRQGDTLSPILSILMINPIITYINKTYKGYTFKNNKRINIPLLAYCDDIILISDSIREILEIIHELNEYTETVGLQISTDHKKTIIMTNSVKPIKITLNQKGKEVIIKEDKENKTNKYLGIYLNIELDWALSNKILEGRITTKLNALARKRLTAEIKSTLINICVLKILEYHAAFAKIDEETKINIDTQIARIIKYAIPMSNNTCNEDIWMNKKRTGYGVLTADTTISCAIITKINHILAYPNSIAYTTLIQRMKDDPNLQKTRENNIISIKISENNTQLTRFVEINKAKVKVIETKSLVIGEIENQESEIETETDLETNEGNDTIYCWTDGSKDKDRVGIGVFFKTESKLNTYRRLHETIDINEAELIAIELALTIAPTDKNLVIFIDNNNARNHLNYLVTLNRPKIKYEFHATLTRINKLIIKRKTQNPEGKIEGIRVPSHISKKFNGDDESTKKVLQDLNYLEERFGSSNWIIEGNCEADRLAKLGSNSDNKIPLILGGQYTWELCNVNDKEEIIPLKGNPRKLIKEKQFIDMEKSLCKKKMIETDLELIGNFQNNSKSNFRHVRELRRTQMNGHTLRKSCHKQLNSKNPPARLKRREHAYMTGKCPSCLRDPEDNTHFLVECTEYKEIRKEHNKNINKILKNCGSTYKNIIITKGSDHRWIKKSKPWEHKMYKKYLNMKGYLDFMLICNLRSKYTEKEVIKTVENIIKEIAEMLYEMKELRNRNLQELSKHPTRNENRKEITMRRRNATTENDDM